MKRLKKGGGETDGCMVWWRVTVHPEDEGEWEDEGEGRSLSGEAEQGESVEGDEEGE